MAPPEVSAGTLQRLGAHDFRGEHVLLAEGDGVFPGRRDRTTAVDMTWGALDLYRGERRVDDRLQWSQIRLPDAAWRGTGESFEAVEPATGSSEALFQTVQLWREFISPFGQNLVYDALADGTRDGRPTHRYAVGLREELEFRAWEGEPLALSGTIEVDAETGNRLHASLEGELRFPTARQARVSVRYEETRALLAEPPEISPPPAGQTRVDPPGSDP